MAKPFQRNRGPQKTERKTIRQATSAAQDAGLTLGEIKYYQHLVKEESSYQAQAQEAIQNIQQRLAKDMAGIGAQVDEVLEDMAGRLGERRDALKQLLLATMGIEYTPPEAPEPEPEPEPRNQEVPLPAPPNGDALEADTGEAEGEQEDKLADRPPRGLPGATGGHELPVAPG